MSTLVQVIDLTTISLGQQVRARHDCYLPKLVSKGWHGAYD
jgi:hypothetical protein